MKTVYALILAALPLVACGGSDAEEGQGEDNVTAVREKATLIPTKFKKTVTGADGSKCVYDITYVQVLAPQASSGMGAPAGTVTTSPTVVSGKFLNAALNYGPTAPETTKCDENVSITGGYTAASVNESSVLSVLYSFEAMYEGVPGEFIKPLNLNLSTGKAIALADILSKSGKDKLIATCKTQFAASLAEMQIPSNPALESACKDAVTLNTVQKSEDFTITKQGIRVHVDRQLAHAYMAVAGDGFLVKWSELGTGLKSGSPVKGLAGR